MAAYSPPYQITPTILKTVAEISEVLGQLKSLHIDRPNPILRKQNSIRTIQGSLAIEGNSFSLSQVSAVLEGKRVLGAPREILEVRNAIETYSLLSRLDPSSEKSLLKAHRSLMKGLISRPGKYRMGAIGILKGSKVSHVAPPASRVPALMGDLFEYLRTSKDLPLIKSCVFHYEFEFVHPFEDGNGRMGRLWQTLVLAKHSPVFEFIPVESQIHAHQKEYYRILESCDRNGDCTAFIEWMLGIILITLKEFSDVSLPETPTFESRIETARQAFGRQTFSRAEYLKLIKTISAATASRDLARAVDEGILKRSGEKRTSLYHFK